MRWILASCLVLAACRFPIERGGSFSPRAQPGQVSIVLVPDRQLGIAPDDREQQAYEAMVKALVATLEGTPHVHVEIREKSDRGNDRGDGPFAQMCRDAGASGVDYMVTLAAEARSIPMGHCADHDVHPMAAVEGVIDPHQRHDVVTCARWIEDPPVATAAIKFHLVQPAQCRFGDRAGVLKSWLAPRTPNADPQDLLAAKIAEATAWMSSHLKDALGREAIVTPQADGRAVLPVGSEDGVHEGDVYAIYSGPHGAGYARAADVAPHSTEIERVYGAAALDAGQVAVPREVPWVIEVGPRIGMGTSHRTVQGVESSAQDVLLGLHLRTHPLGSGPIFGVEADGLLATNPALLLGPEAGWGFRLDRHFELHAVGAVKLVDGETEAGTRVVGGGVSALAGVTFSGQYGFVMLEAGGLWTSSMSAAAQSVDYRGAIVQATLGLSLL